MNWSYPIFHVVDLYPYTSGDKDVSTTNEVNGEVSKQIWVKQITMP